jgi:DNA-binding transcriptional regulator YiaG
MQTIREIRDSTGLPQSKFAAALHIPLRTVQAWEIGERACPPYVVELIAYRVQHDPIFRKEGKA